MEREFDPLTGRPLIAGRDDVLGLTTTSSRQR